MEALLSCCSQEPIELTYLGIGSCPHVPKGGRLEPKYDQLFPACFHERVNLDRRPMRLLHFDPLFSHSKEFLDAYFAELKMIPQEWEHGYAYVGEACHALIVSERIDHAEHQWFFESLVEILLQTKGKLIVQEFTGYSLQPLNRTLFQACPQKELYKRRILLDMTFGTDLGCCTDMTKVQPFYDYSGNFLNLHFMDQKDLVRWIGISSNLDKIIKQRAKTEFLQMLNQIHVDYRRKLRGEPPLTKSELYDETTDAETLMKILQASLQKPFATLLALRVVSPDTETNLKEAYSVYKGMDPYKWYDLVYKQVCSV